jgi:hypothetical protein
MFADHDRKHLNEKKNKRGTIIAYSNEGKSVRFISDPFGIVL